MLLPSVLAAAAVTAWAFAKSALTDDRVALAAREDAGVEFGLILLAMVVLLFCAGIAIQLRAERRPLAERDPAPDRDRGDRRRGVDAAARARRAGVQRARHRRHGLGPLARPHERRRRDTRRTSRAG